MSVAKGYMHFLALVFILQQTLAASQPRSPSSVQSLLCSEGCTKYSGDGSGRKAQMRDRVEDRDLCLKCKCESYDHKNI